MVGMTHSVTKVVVETDTLTAVYAEDNLPPPGGATNVGKCVEESGSFGTPGTSELL